MEAIQSVTPPSSVTPLSTRHPLLRRSVALRTAVEQRLQRLAQPLPPLVRVLPPGVRPRLAPAGVVVGWFDNDSDDGRHWGGAVAELIRLLLADLAGTELRQPPLSLRQLDDDVWHPGYRPGEALHGLRNLQQLGDKYDIGAALCGRVETSRGRFVIEVDWLLLADGLCQARHRVEAACVDELPAALAGLSRWCLRRLGAACGDEQHRRWLARLPAAGLADYATLFTLWREDAADKRAQPFLHKLNTLNPFVASAAALCWFGRAAMPGAAVYLGDDEPGELAWLKLCAIGAAAPASLQRELSSRMLAQARSRPADLALWQACARQLARAGDSAAGLRLALELLRLSPTQYRSWWTFASALCEHAWHFRGALDWDQMREDDQRLFCELNKLALQAAGVALELQPNNPSLLCERLRLENGCSQALWQLFQRAIRLAPACAELYYSAMCYTAPKWGGAIDLQLEIVARAIENNPGASWPWQMYRRYLEGSRDYGLLTRTALMFYRRFSRTDWPRCAIGRLG